MNDRGEAGFDPEAFNRLVAGFTTNDDERTPAQGRGVERTGVSSQRPSKQCERPRRYAAVYAEQCDAHEAREASWSSKSP